jgi:hypothetical protein
MPDEVFEVCERFFEVDRLLCSHCKMIRDYGVDINALQA